MPWPEQPFTALEQTTPGPMITALWPFADVPKKMTLVHGSLYSRCSSLEAKRQLRFEAFLPTRRSLLDNLQDVPNPRSTPSALARAKARFCHAFKALLTS
jgi:hypothetical protein